MGRQLSELTSIARKLALKTAIACQKDPWFRKSGRSVDIIQTGRTLEEQRENFRRGVSKTMDSYHLWGGAVDFGIAEKWRTKVLKFFWTDKEAYKRFADIALEQGWRSYEITWKWDSGHVELPLIFQGSAPHCYGYVAVNMLQFAKTKYRALPKKYCYDLATRITRQISERKITRSVESSLGLLKEWGYIKGWEKLGTRDISQMNKQDWQALNKKNVIISQKTKPMGRSGSERWKKHQENIRHDLGIFNHTALCYTADDKGLLMANSHKKYPEYRISYNNIKKAVRAAYIVEV
jgi:hypothetical protein